MSQRLPACVSPDRKCWSAAGNDHARLRQRHRHRNTRDSDAMRGASTRETAVTALPGQSDIGTPRRSKPTIVISAPVQSP